MRFSLPALTGSLAVLAGKPEIQVEATIRVSPVEVVQLGTIVVDAAGLGTWVPLTGASIPAEGYDLHLRADDGAFGVPIAPTVTLNVNLFGAVAGTATAVLEIPTWVADQSKNFPVGRSSDFVPQGAGNAAKTVLSIVTLGPIGGLPASSEWSIWGSPPASNFVKIGYKRNATAPYQTPAAVNIADGYNPVGASKRGRPEVGEATFDFAHISSMSGMARYNGTRVTVWEAIVKDKAAWTENVVFTGFRGQASPTRGDGNDEVVESCTGSYERHLLFHAP